MGSMILSSITIIEELSSARSSLILDGISTYYIIFDEKMNGIYVKVDMS